MASGAEREVLVVVAHPDDEILWHSPVLPAAARILAAFDTTSANAALNEGRARVRAQYPLAGFAFLGLLHAEVYSQSDFLSRAPAAYGVTLMRSCPPETAELYRSNYDALVRAVDRYVGRHTDIYTHNPWGEYGHEEHIQVHRAMVELAQRHQCSLWVWDGFPAEELAARDVWMRADYYPDETLAGVPTTEHDVDLERFREIRALYQQEGAWTWSDTYLPPSPSRYLQVVQDGTVLVTPRRLSPGRRADIARQIVSRKARYYAGAARRRI
ncbi:MAG TPA: hypothetical protein VMF60_08310 [Acidimicrobiales bacterium]|nr:hypothetical protein [Acidimicrobiales bacterium]